MGKIPQIPGWKPIARTSGGSLYLSTTSQLVNGVWYDPKHCGSLQKLVDEWLEGVRGVYMRNSVLRLGRLDVSLVAQKAAQILKEWGMLDNKGRVIESE